jgi:PAS domain S-box-containing protein
MIEKLSNFFLEKYMDADYLLQQKAKIFFAICITILVGAIPIFIISNIYHQRGTVPILSPAVAFFLLVITLFILKRGYYAFSVNLIVIIMFIGVWITIFIGDEARHPIERVDTVVLILALLTYIPLMIVEQKSGILIYFVANVLAFILALPILKHSLNIPQITLTEYFVDTIMAFIFIFITSYQIFSISKKALNIAQVEIERNRELNRNLIQSEETYRNLFHNAQVGLFRVRVEDGKALECNEQHARMFGYESREEFIKEFIAEKSYVDPKMRQELLSMLRRDGEIKGFEAEFRRKDGSIIWVRSSSRLYPNRGCIEGVAEDITEQKHAKEALNIQHRLGITLSGVTNLKEALFLIMNTALKVKSIDSGSVHILDHYGGFTLEHSAGLSDTFVKKITYYDKDTEFATSIMKGKPLYINYEEYSRDKEEWHSDEGLKGFAIIPVLYQNQVIACMNVASHTSYVIDDTSKSTLETIASQIGSSIKRLKAEEKIKDSLKEKDILLKEIHHRVKNNMQIISSLLNLQLRHVRDERDVELFKDSQNRVHSLALVHEKLYKSEDLSRIDFDEYSKSLTAELFHSYQVNPSMIKFDIHVKEIYLGVNVAIPCALIINELVSNSLKYAFEDSKEGMINIDFNATHEKGGDAYTLIVADNGIGIPEDLNYINTETLGLQLVNTLTNQLKGNIELDRSRGTKFTITF